MKKLLIVFMGLWMIMSCSKETTEPTGTRVKDYTVTIASGINHGSIITDKNKAVEGETVTINVTPESGYILDTLNVTDSNSNPVKVINNTFVMPESNVFISASFRSAYYSVNIPNIIMNGSINTDKLNAKAGEKVNLFVKPNEGAVLVKLEVITENNSIISLSGTEDVKSFIMPSQDVSICAKFYYLPNSPLVFLPSEITDGTAGNTGSYVTFGSWPQNLKEEDVEVDETESVIVGDFTYYHGSDNFWYVKTICEGYNGIKSKQFISKQEYDNKIPQYYKVEPIKWRILTTNYDNGSSTGKRLILAENILIVSPFYDNNIIRTISGETIYPNNYEHSRVRAFLNGLSYIIKDSESSSQIDNEIFENKGFLFTAFNENERSLIANTKIIDNTENALPMDYNSLSDSYKSRWGYGINLYTSGSMFHDKIFLLCVKELTNTEYSFSGYETYSLCSTRRLEPTFFCEATGYCYSSYSSNWDSYGRWWTRSPSHYDYSYENSGNHDLGSGVNAIYSHGGSPFWDSTSYAYNKNYGIVPALCLE